MATKKRSKINNLYLEALQGKDLENYKQLVSCEISDILLANFRYVHCRLLSLLSGDVELKASFKRIIELAEELCENGELSEDDLLEIKRLLGGVNLQQIANISSTASTLAVTASKVSKEGDIFLQNKILKQFLIDILQKSQDTVARQLAINALATLKLEAGLPTERLNELLEMTAVDASPDLD
ncbi:hypothetical protein F7734_49080 [Scytonema sp. UIC 10036]|uniref:hypothetical protein n=1 Tax=Scytonema sp. UIC 10036 TaxID=2304196 RepID=UPI0012DA1F0F|nr:hypothetical protein [Scytonema sp. UIC 10036]MUG99809.1 hypothetical protein [Scytonema sp. UIC 10036]